MKTAAMNALALNISDLNADQALDSKALKAVSGGYNHWHRSYSYRLLGTSFAGYVYINGRRRTKVMKHHERKWTQTNHFSSISIV